MPFLFRHWESSLITYTLINSHKIKSNISIHFFWVWLNLHFKKYKMDLLSKTLHLVIRVFLDLYECMLYLLDILKFNAFKSNK